MAFVTLAVLTALCLLLASTRKYSIFLAGLLLYFYPLLTLGVLAVAGIAFFYQQPGHYSSKQKGTSPDRGRTAG